MPASAVLLEYEPVTVTANPRRPDTIGKLLAR